MVTGHTPEYIIKLLVFTVHTGIFPHFLHIFSDVNFAVLRLRF